MANEVFIGEVVPNLNASSPTAELQPLVLANTPPATGGITVAQSPSGTSVTNTGRTKEATASYMTASLNALNVGTIPPAAKN